jgi:hypothetical protein
MSLGVPTVQRFQDNPRVTAPLVLGVSALVAAIAVGGWAYFRDPQAMQSNLLAEGAGLLLEIAVAVILVDWVISRRDKSRWKHAYPIVSDRLATAYTDVMRLLYVASTKSAGAASDVTRYREFYDRLCSNLDHLRSTIEGFVLAFDSPSHYTLRALELKMRWLKDHLASPNTDCSLQFEVALEIAKDFDAFCKRTWAGQYEKVKNTVLTVARQRYPDVLSYSKPLSRLTARNCRLELQDAVLHAQFGTQRPHGVLYDYRQETSMYYFVIDLLLLPHHVMGPVTSNSSSSGRESA